MPSNVGNKCKLQTHRSQWNAVSTWHFRTKRNTCKQICLWRATQFEVCLPKQHMMLRSNSRNNAGPNAEIWVQILAAKLSELHFKTWMLVSVWEVPCGMVVCEVLWCQTHKRSEPNTRYWQVECVWLPQSTSHWKCSTCNDWMLCNSNGSSAPGLENSAA